MCPMMDQWSLNHILKRKDAYSRIYAQDKHVKKQVPHVILAEISGLQYPCAEKLPITKGHVHDLSQFIQVTSSQHFTVDIVLCYGGLVSGNLFLAEAL